MVGGGTTVTWALPPQVAKLLWVLAVLTMTVGNTLGLLQFNVKRVLAYSSIAHSGYMLVGLATVAWAGSIGKVNVLDEALQGVLFYLAAYGMMNVAAFGVLMLLPSRDSARRAATSAETFEDLAGTGRLHPALGLAMAVACFSLIGIPLTVGFFGKFYLVRPALDVQDKALVWLVVLTMINAAISAGYYLRIVGAMFLRPAPATAPVEPHPHHIIDALPMTLAIVLSVAGVLFFGSIPPATEDLSRRSQAVTIDSQVPLTSPHASTVR
jgi:NADH-quinone oxidoreductase subunit N